MAEWPSEERATYHANSLQLYRQAQDAHERVVDAAAQPAAGLSDVLVVVVMAAAAVEANINEVAAIASGPGDGWQFNTPAALVELNKAVEAIDEQRLKDQVMRKYEAAAAALGVPLLPGRQPWQGGRDLMDLRDAVLHVRPKVEHDAKGNPTMPKVARQLIQRGQARRPPPKSLPTWLDLIKTIAVSEWVQRAALGLMRHITENLPLPPDHMLGALAHRWDRTLIDPRP